LDGSAGAAGAAGGAGGADGGLFPNSLLMKLMLQAPYRVHRLAWPDDKQAPSMKCGDFYRQGRQFLFHERAAAFAGNFFRSAADFINARNQH
jgi:hypothetical protein